ncbi:RDD family protein [bacterium]|nr:RDD family protein [bacterium]
MSETVDYVEAAQPQATPVSVAYAGFWRRVLAAIIDGIILSAIFWIIGGGDFSGASWIVTTAIAWLYYALLESSAKQATLGKMAVGVIVTNEDGKRISILRATGRHFAKWISAIILCIGFIMVAFTEKKQGLHDMLADTLVIKVK